MSLAHPFTSINSIIVCQLHDKLAFLDRGRGHFPLPYVNPNLSYDRKGVRNISLILRDHSFIKSLEPTGAGTGTLFVSLNQISGGGKGWRKHSGVPCRNRRG